MSIDSPAKENKGNSEGKNKDKGKGKREACLPAVYDVCIVGAGVVGSMLARSLAAYQLRVLLLEAQPDVAMGSSKANSAIVHGGYAESHSKLKGRLCYQGRKQFAQLEEELHFGFRACSSLVLCREVEGLRKLEELYENGLKNGLPDLKLLSGEETRQLEADLPEQILGALYCEGAGICSPYELVVALVDNALANGVDLQLSAPLCSAFWQPKPSTQANTTGEADGHWVLSTPKGEWKARYVVNAAGLCAQEVAEAFGDSSIHLHPRSGEYLLLRRGSPSPSRVLFQLPSKMGKGILVTPTYADNVLIGPDALDEAQPNWDTHVDRLLAIFQEAKLSFPKLSLHDFIRSFTGLRALAEEDDFVVRPSEVAPQLLHLAGIQSPGLTSSPALAQLAIEKLGLMGLTLEKKATFSPQRLADHPPLQQKQWLEGKALQEAVNRGLQDPACLVCRCEQVSTATLNALQDKPLPPPTLDGIKRRSRAGMGACQGSFCRNRLLQLAKLEGWILADELTDVQRAGYSRVGRAELLKAWQEQEELRTQQEQKRE